ncbi:MAG TPA: chromate efflux transporter [Tepidisphaeraceae bacterium]|nr:chromate efflux transporter [Tepidisphaeraceae bacterium]
MSAASDAISETTPATTPRQRRREVALLFLRLGFTAFGGPAAHVAMMEDEVVTRRRWIDRQHFLDLLAAINFVPGPNSTELAIHLGLIRAGRAGLVIAGVCFIVPAVLIILPLAWVYCAYGTGPNALPHVEGMMSAIGACVLAIIAAALWRFARTGIRDAFTTTIAIAVAGIGFLPPRYTGYQPELVSLALSALAGAIWYGRPRAPGSARAALLVLGTPLWDPDLGRLGLFFLKVGATLFGSGYVLVSYLKSGLVDQFQWLTEAQLLDAIAIGQITPGPLLTTATFAGYLIGYTTFDGGVSGGVAGAVIATVAIFLPSFLFILVLGPLLQRIRTNRYARGALDGMNAAVVALILVVTIGLAGASFFPGGQLHLGNVVLAVTALAALLALHLNSTWVVLIGGVVGWMLW